VANLPFAQLDVLHLAAHAVARDDDPSLSAVYLSAYDSRGLPMENPALTAEKVLQLGMRAELVVLSGCSTAGGTPLAGEGMLGLTHSFLANGSGAVLASLWAVDDAETARFIGDFYEAYSKGFDAAESLALAQRKWIAQSPQPDSWGTWASFVVRQGRVLDIKKGGGELQ
jgi:CHAT domain-containing protein